MQNLNQTGMWFATAKRANLWVLLFLTMAVLVCVPCSSQQPIELLKGQYKTIPLHGNSPAQAMRESAAGQTIQMWTYQFLSPKDGNVYSGQILGGNWIGPYGYTEAWIVPTYLVPVIVNLHNASGGVAYTFDPTVTPTGCAGWNEPPVTAVQASPLFDRDDFGYVWGNPAVDLGFTQYVDALLTAEFWTLGNSLPTFHQSFIDYRGWHDQFDLSVTTGAVTVDVPSGYWGAITNLPCVGTTGAVDFTWFDNYVQTTLIPSLASQGVGPTVFPVLLTYNVATSPNQGQTIYLGYHEAYGSPMQIYAEAMFDTTGIFKGSQDVTDLSHEMAETMNDPTGMNATPPWGNIGQVTGCQSNFEVGDPLSGTEYPAQTFNGHTYHLQELALFGWFFDSWPPTGNWGIPGWYSTNGTFTGTSKVCPPGGTN